MTIKILIDDPNNPDEEILIELPSRYEVCWLCDGKGSHTNPLIDGNGLTESDLQDWDYEMWDDYRSGKYDVDCWACNGLRVQEVVNSSYVNMSDPGTALAYEKWEANFSSAANDLQLKMRICGGSPEPYYGAY